MPTYSLLDLDPDCDLATQGRLYYDLEPMLLPYVLCGLTNCHVEK
jgi:hypothetical protein